jgi:hypothetical protein
MLIAGEGRLSSQNWHDQAFAAQRKLGVDANSGWAAGKSPAINI